MSDKRIKRLRELSDAVTKGYKGQSEFTMRIPAEPDRDADLVLDWAANEIESLEAEVAELRAALKELMEAKWMLSRG